jgi:hypothetical protein
VTLELDTSYACLSAVTAPETGGISMPLWREAGSGNAPACPIADVTSRHGGAMTTFPSDVSQ